MTFVLSADMTGVQDLLPLVEGGLKEGLLTREEAVELLVKEVRVTVEHGES